MTLPFDKTMYNTFDLAVLAEGKFTSAFEKEPGSEENEKDELKTTTHLSKGNQNAKLFVANTSYITSGQLINAEGTEPIAMFVRNAVDYMNGNTDLCTMRTKGLNLTTLQHTQSVWSVIIRYFNQFGLAVLTALAGLFMWHKRSARKRQIHDTYNPDDKREIKK